MIGWRVSVAEHTKVLYKIIVIHDDAKHLISIVNAELMRRPQISPRQPPFSINVMVSIVGAPYQRISSPREVIPLIIFEKSCLAGGQPEKLLHDRVALA